MFLKRLTAANFRNIAACDIELSPKINCFTGNNGMGKSNLLDAVYFLSFCRSFTMVPDSRLVRRGEQFFTASASYERSGQTFELTAGYQPGRRKSFRLNGKEYKRLSEHIGRFPLVMASPADQEIVAGASDERRRFIDQIAGQSNPAYVEALIRYNALLEQRNRMLRDHIVDHNLYAAVEIPMVAAALTVEAERRDTLDRLKPIFDRHFRAIAGDGAEEVDIAYESTFAPGNPDPIEQLNSARRRDEVLGHTTVGVHRDDINLTIDSMPLRRTASQGQCKTVVTALRLAQFEFLSDARGFRPLLLLDDIFDKLDAGRVERIVDIVATDTFGQILITDTNRDHLDAIIDRSSGSHALWTVDHGTFTPLNRP